MHTLKLHISDSIYDKVMWLLKKFDKSEIEIISEDAEFAANKMYLHEELNKLK